MDRLLSWKAILPARLPQAIPIDAANPASTLIVRLLSPTLAEMESWSRIGAFEMAENTETLDIKQFQLHGKDTGSADVQVALLTRRIGQLTEHLKSHAKDHSSRRGLLKMVAQRRSLLDYLSRSQAERYKKLIDKLNLRK